MVQYWSKESCHIKRIENQESSRVENQDSILDCCISILDSCKTWSNRNGLCLVLSNSFSNLDTRLLRESTTFVQVLSNLSMNKKWSLRRKKVSKQECSLTPLLCSPYFQRAQYLDICTLTHELILLLSLTLPDDPWVNYVISVASILSRRWRKGASLHVGISCLVIQ